MTDTEVVLGSRLNLRSESYPTFVMVMGLPCSGKTTLGKRFMEHAKNVTYISFDDIKTEEGLSNSDVDILKVFSIMEDRASEALKSGGLVFYDGSNLHMNRRIKLLARLREEAGEGFNAIVVVTATPIKTCYRRTKGTPREGSYMQFLGIVKKFQLPYYYEGWDDIKIIYPEFNGATVGEDYRRDYEESISSSNFSLYNEFNIGDNEDYLPLGEVLKGTYEKLQKKYSGIETLPMRQAGLLCDIGKFSCKFVDVDGTANYTGHQNIGAYQSLLNRDYPTDYPDSEVLHRAILIMWAAQAHIWVQPKGRDKYTKLLGNDIIREATAIRKAHDQTVKECEDYWGKLVLPEYPGFERPKGKLLKTKERERLLELEYRIKQRERKHGKFVSKTCKDSQAS